MKIARSFLFLSVFLLHLGCFTETGNPEAQLLFGRLGDSNPVSGNISSSLLASAQSQNLSIPIVSTDGNQQGTIEVTDARIVFGKIRFLGSDGVANIQFEGPYVFNVLTLATQPAVGKIPVAPGLYRGAELRVEKTKSLVANSDILFDNSIVLTGVYTGLIGSTQYTNVSFEMTFDLSENFSMKGNQSEFQITDGANKLLIGLDTKRWLQFSLAETNPKQVDFRHASLQSGKLVFDKNSSDQMADLRAVIRKNIEATARQGKDRNGNNRLDTDEYL